MYTWLDLNLDPPASAVIKAVYHQARLVRVLLQDTCFCSKKGETKKNIIPRRL